jgi:hypothetical protein
MKAACPAGNRLENCLSSTTGLEEDACPELFLFTLYSQYLWQPDFFQFRLIPDNYCDIKGIWNHGLA